MKNENNISPLESNKQLKVNPFTVEDGYFDQLPIDIGNKISQTAIKRDYFSAWKPILITTSIATIFAGYFIFNNINNKSTPTSSPIESDLYSELIMDNNLMDIDESMLIDELVNASTEIDDSTEARPLQQLNINEIATTDTVTLTEEDILEYILEEDTDIESL